MLRHRLARHGHVLAQGRERLATLTMQLVEQAPAGRVGQGLEDFVDVQRWCFGSSGGRETTARWDEL